MIKDPMEGCVTGLSNAEARPALRSTAAGQKVWSRADHRWPCAETDRLDAALNDLESRTIHLTPDDIAYCRCQADRRNDVSIGYRNRKVGLWTDGYIHFIGALGECAVCRYLAIPYRAGINTFRQPDLPGRIEVRTRTAMWHQLKVRPDDLDDSRVVLAICRKPGEPVYLIGWILAADAKRSFPTIDPRQANQPFHAVSHEHLHPMASIRTSTDQKVVDGPVGVC